MAARPLFISTPSPQTSAAPAATIASITPAADNASCVAHSAVRVAAAKGSSSLAPVVDRPPGLHDFAASLATCVAAAVAGARFDCVPPPVADTPAYPRARLALRKARRALLSTYSQRLHYALQRAQWVCSCIQSLHNMLTEYIISDVRHYAVACFAHKHLTSSFSRPYW